MNKSDKLYKTIDEQLDILEKRKITIGNRGFAKKVLAYENYYYSNFAVAKSLSYS